MKFKEDNLLDFYKPMIDDLVKDTEIDKKNVNHVLASLLRQITDEPRTLDLLKLSAETYEQQEREASYMRCALD